MGSLGDANLRKRLQETKVSPKVKDYLAGYTWVHDIVIKTKKEDDQASVFSLERRGRLGRY